MSVVGFDFGNQNCYVAVARQGGIETVPNDYSLIATPSCVAFAAQTRLMGVAARQQISTNIKNTVHSFKHLVGRKFKDSVVQNEMAGLPFAVIEGQQGATSVKISFLGEERVFTIEQIMAMMLLKLKDIAEAYLLSKVFDCVISIPSFWTDAQRRCMIDAAQITGLNVLRIINETAAVALNYGIYKQDLPEVDAKPRTVAFVSMGHSSTQASICHLNKGKLKILHTVFDYDLGGRNFDYALREHFGAEFKSHFKVDAKSKPRAWLRLADECEKLKKTMSSNQTAIPLNIECFMDDKDVAGKMKRSDFEALCTACWDRLERLMKNLLSESKIHPQAIDAVELVGGSTRIPRVKQLIQQTLGREPSTTLNQDEAVCRGAALQCAILSPTFRVREFSVTDVQPYSIKLSWTTEKGDEGEAEVFPENHQFPFSKILTFYRSEPFMLEASYSYPNTIPYASTYIGKFRILNVTGSPQGEASKVKVKIRMNPNGVFLVSSASMYEKVADEPEQMEILENDTENSKLNEGDADDKMEANGPSASVPENSVGENTDGRPPVNGEGQAPGEPGTEAGLEKDDKDAKANKQEPVVKPTKPKIKSVDLPVDSQVMQMSGNELERFRNAENKLQAHDRAEREKINMKNSLEEYIYEMRDKISDSLSPFVAEKDAAGFRSMLESTENWLYEDGEDQPTQVYVERKAELRKFGDPIVERYHEAQERPRAFDELARSLLMTRKVYESWAGQDPNYDHLEPKDMDKVRKAIEERQVWFDEAINKQQRQPLTEPPSVMVVQIREARESFERIVSPIITKQKPKVEPPPAPAADPADGAEDGEPMATDGANVPNGDPEAGKRTTRSGKNKSKNPQPEMEVD